ncbi:MAG: PKD-like family lipoprotein [Odoribacter splanchnicus]
MKNIIKIALLLLTTTMLAYSCYDDEGNYSYTDINEVGIKVDETINVRLPKGDDSTLVEIVPELSQSLLENESNLSFLWTSVAGLKEESVEYGRQKICSLYVKADSKDFKMRLTVTDASTTVKWYKEIALKMVPPFSNSYFVLQDVGGSSVLGAVDGEGEAGFVIPNVYQVELGSEIPIAGKPIALVGNETYGSVCPLPENLYYLYGCNKKQRTIAIVTEQDIMVLNAENFRNIHADNLATMMKCIRDYSPAPEKLLSAEGHGEMLINNGKLYWANMDGYSLFRSVTMNDSETFSAQNVGALGKKGYIVYDDSKQRFLVSLKGSDFYYETDYNKRIYNGSSAPTDDNGATLEKIGKTDVENEFNPDQVEGISKVLDIISGGSGFTHTYACAIGTDNMIHIFRFNADGWPNSDDIARCDGYYHVALPEGVQNGEELSFAVSSAYDGILFIAGGNKIYKLDTKRAQPKLSAIYEYENSAAKITRIKFKYPNTYYQTQYKYTLAASVDNGGDNSIIEMLLNSAGDVSRDNQSIHEYKGFGKIVDFAYCFKYNYQ